VLKRILQWKSSVAGLGITAVLVYLFNSLECKAPSDWEAWIAVVLPTILGMLSKDK
jgi:hypothetical protein